MILAALHAVDKHYGDQTVLEGATLELRPGSRTALIGRNGAGKSTVLRLLMGLETPDGGRVHVRDDVEIGMLEQDPEFAEGETVLGSCERAFEALDAMEADLARLEREGLDDPATYGRWEALHERFARRGGYERRARRDAVLHALGFRGREGERVGGLSGGERTRLGLARLLMAQPDVLLLDEPTNHLDIAMRGWLEGFVARYPGAALIVSHDRAFLDGACDATAEVKLGTLRTHSGNPSAYRAARAEQERIEERTRANQARERERLAASADQMKRWAGNNAKLHRRAKAMERRVDRFEAGMIDGPEGTERTTRFAFDSDPTGEIVLQAEHLTRAFGGRTLFEDVSVTVRAGERIAIVGPNGAGKTTFLRTLIGEAPSDDGRAQVRWGARTRVGYYDQTLSGVDEDATLFEEVVRMVGDQEAHDLLGRFLFPYEAQFKRVADLSGGERARLALLKLVLARRNVLVLDEPTNHLDVEMIEALEDALAAFEGTLILVSHDRSFLARVADRVWELDGDPAGGRLERFDGDWSHYQRVRRAREAAASEAAERAAREERAEREAGNRERGAGSGRSRWRLERDLEALEARVAELEGALSDAAERLADPAGLDPDAVVSLGAEHARLEGELLEAIAAWEAAQEELEAAG